MNDFRPASIFADDIETLESAGEALFRHHENSDAIRLLAIALRLRGQTGFQKYAELTERGNAASDPLDQENSLAGSLPGWAGGLRRPQPPLREFRCDDIDESAGLADVVELNGYSRKTPPMGCGA